MFFLSFYAYNMGSGNGNLYILYFFSSHNLSIVLLYTWYMPSVRVCHALFETSPLARDDDFGVCCFLGQWLVG